MRGAPLSSPGGTYENFNRFFNLQAPFSPPSRHFSSYTTHTTPPSLLLAYTLHTPLSTPPPTFTLLSPLPPNRTTSRFVLCPYLPVCAPVLYFQQFCFYFSAYTSGLCTLSNARTTLGPRATPLFHYIIVEIVFCEFCFYFSVLFLTISHGFRKVRYVSAQFTSNITLHLDSDFRFRFLSLYLCIVPLSGLFQRHVCHVAIPNLLYTRDFPIPL